MPLGFIRRFLGIRREESGELGEAESEIAASAVGSVLSDQPTYSSIDMYTLLEDERISREIWGLMLGWATRDMALTYWRDSDQRWLYYKRQAILTLAEVMLASIQPSPIGYDSLSDYVKESYANQLLIENLDVWGEARQRRALQGFERVMQSKRMVAIEMKR